MFLAWHEIRRAKLRFGLLAGAVGLLVFLILFQQALLNGLITQFIGALKNQSADVLVYNDQARQNLEGSVILPDQLAAIGEVEGVAVASPLGEATFTVQADGADTDAVLFGYVLGGPGEPTTLSSGRLPEGPAEAVASAKDKDDGFGIGDTVTVIGPGGALDVKVVGIADELNFSVAPTLFVDFDTFADAKRIRGGVGPEVPVQPSVVAIAVADGVDPQTVVDRVNAEVDGVEALTRDQAVAQTPGVSSVRTSFGVILGLFYLVVPLVTGLFFLIVTFQKASALTLLRAIGASARSLVVSLLVQVVAVMAIGSLIAFGLYAFAIQGFSSLGVEVEVLPAVITSGAVLALALLTSLVAVRRVLRIDPINATTGAGVNV
ncbi:MAG TPA: peptide ABC transporter permease [Acidimicrobiaceae bacterium]|nr:peptide ABC transporter permease [Acidimicrobiaceae bacterium]